MAKQKHIKQVKSYSLPPDQIAWLRARAAQETTPEKTVSASNVLERIIDAAMDRTKKQLPSLQNPKTKKASNRLKHSQPGITHDGLKLASRHPQHLASLLPRGQRVRDSHWRACGSSRCSQHCLIPGIDGSARA